MEIIKIIRDKDVGLETPNPNTWTKRIASRGIIFNSNDKLALLNVSRRRYHKLPGGGIDPDEDLLEGLKREILEEVGCKIKEIRELVIIEEYFGEESQHQIDHCFLAKVDGKVGPPSLTKQEKSWGFEVIWVNLEEGIKILETEVKNVVEDYEGKFITLRDLTFLKEVRRILN